MPGVEHDSDVGHPGSRGDVGGGGEVGDAGARDELKRDLESELARRHGH
jgi:hypothetical protein